MNICRPEKVLTQAKDMEQLRKIHDRWSIRYLKKISTET